MTPKSPAGFRPLPSCLLTLPLLPRWSNLDPICPALPPRLYHPPPTFHPLISFLSSLPSFLQQGKYCSILNLGNSLTFNEHTAVCHGLFNTNTRRIAFLSLSPALEEAGLQIADPPPHLFQSIWIGSLSLSCKEVSGAPPPLVQHEDADHSCSFSSFEFSLFQRNWFLAMSWKLVRTANIFFLNSKEYFG